MKTTPIVVAAALLSAVFLSGCGQQQDAAAPKPGAASKQAAAPKKGAQTPSGCKDAAGIRALVKDPAAVTSEQYLAVLESYACCAVDPKKLAFDNKTCATTKALKALKDAKVKLPPVTPLFDKLAAHSAPQVRAVGYGKIAELVDSGQAGVNAAKKAFATETDPYALRALVRGAQSVGNKVPEAGEFLLKMAAHKHPHVRAAAAAALSNSKSAKVPGALDTVLTLMGDKDARVRKAACSNAGNSGNEAVIAPIVSILGDASKADMHGDCMRGLTRLWLDAPKHRRTSAAAYKATLDYYKTTPRSDAMPAAKAIPPAGEFGRRGDVDAWRAKASYYRPDEIIAAMTAIVKDPKASEGARISALKLIGQTGGAAALDKLAPVIGALGDSKAAAIKNSYNAAKEAAKEAGKDAAKAAGKKVAEAAQAAAGK